MADSKKSDLGLLEEDDEFEEFPAEGWTGKAEDEDDVNVWEDNWDDDNIDDDFSNQLRAELEKQALEEGLDRPRRVGPWIYGFVLDDVLKIKSTYVKQKYPHLKKMVKTALCFTHGNADLKKGFSESKKNVTSQEASLIAASVNSISTNHHME